MRLSARLILGITALFLSSVAFAQGQVAIEPVPWPEVADCAPCSKIQFGPLEMRLSPSELDRVLVLNSDASALTIVESNVGGKLRSGSFVSHGQSRLQPYVGKLFPEHEKMNAVAFFDAIGRVPSSASDKLNVARRAEGIDHARRYLKMSKPPVVVYWIQTPPLMTQNLYFTVAGSDDFYQLSGNLSPELIKAIVGRLRVQEIP